MKKLTIFQSKKLQVLLEKDKEFVATHMLDYAQLLVIWLVGTAAASSPARITFPIPVGRLYLTETDTENLAVLHEAYQKSGRIEAHLSIPVLDAFIRFDIKFLAKKNGALLLSFFGGVDSQGVRKLDMTMSDMLESAHAQRRMQEGRWRQSFVGTGP